MLITLYHIFFIVALDTNHLLCFFEGQRLPWGSGIEAATIHSHQVVPCQGRRGDQAKDRVTTDQDDILSNLKTFLHGYLL